MTDGKLTFGTGTRTAVRTIWNWRVSSVWRRSAKPAKKLPPPVSTTLPMRTPRRSGSHEWIAFMINAGTVFGRFGFDA